MSKKKQTKQKPILKIAKVREGAIIPQKAHDSDAGYDVYTPTVISIPPQCYQKIMLGIAVEFPVGYAMLVQERSGMATHFGIHTIGNVIDAGYRGEISATLYNGGREFYNAEAGTRVAQVLLIPVANFPIKEVDVKDLSITDRQTKGFGSSGK